MPLRVLLQRCVLFGRDGAAVRRRQQQHQIVLDHRKGRLAEDGLHIRNEAGFVVGRLLIIDRPNDRQTFLLRKAQLGQLHAALHVHVLRAGEHIGKDVVELGGAVIDPVAVVVPDDALLCRAGQQRDDLLLGRAEHAGLAHDDDVAHHEIVVDDARAQQIALHVLAKEREGLVREGILVFAPPVLDVLH